MGVTSILMQMACRCMPEKLTLHMLVPKQLACTCVLQRVLLSLLRVMSLRRGSVYKTNGPSLYLYLSKYS
jgi:hypothetical protein